MTPWREPSAAQNVIFLVEFESVVVCHFGDFGQAGPATRAGARHRPARRPVPPGRRRRADDRRQDGGGDREAASAGVRGADALPDRASFDWDDLETAEPFLAQFGDASPSCASRRMSSRSSGARTKARRCSSPLCPEASLAKRRGSRGQGGLSAEARRRAAAAATRVPCPRRSTRLRSARRRRRWVSSRRGSRTAPPTAADRSPRLRAGRPRCRPRRADRRRRSCRPARRQAPSTR